MISIEITFSISIFSILENVGFSYGIVSCSIVKYIGLSVFEFEHLTVLTIMGSYSASEGEEGVGNQCCEYNEGRNLHDFFFFLTGEIRSSFHQ